MSVARSSGQAGNVGAPTISDLRLSAFWSARACSRFYGANPECQVSVIAPSDRSQKRRRAATLQNVGAPTFPNWNATGTTQHIPVAQAFRPEVFAIASALVAEREIPPRGVVIAAITRTLTPKRGELQEPVIASFIQSQKRRRAAALQNVGAPTFSVSRPAVRP